METDEQPVRLRINIGSFDKAPQLKLRDRLLSTPGLEMEREETTYPRKLLPGTEDPDPLFGTPVWILRVTGEAEVLGRVLPAELSEAVRERLWCGRVSDRLWWSLTEAPARGEPAPLRPASVETEHRRPLLNDRLLFAAE